MVLAEVKVDNIYIVCGYTDMRKSIAGLSTIIVQQFEMRPDEHSMFLFCGKRADRMKALIWEGDGFLTNNLNFNVLTNSEHFCRMVNTLPRNIGNV